MQSSRRGFIRGLTGLTAVGAGGCFTFGKGDKIRLAAVGVGGKGFSDWLPMIESGKAVLVAMCDADATQRDKAQARLDRLIKEGRKKQHFNIMDSSIPFYTDYRKLLDDINNGVVKVDAMTISTPDHAHAAKHVCHKRLTVAPRKLPCGWVFTFMSKSLLCAHFGNSICSTRLPVITASSRRWATRVRLWMR